MPTIFFSLVFSFPLLANVDIGFSNGADEGKKKRQ